MQCIFSYCKEDLSGDLLVVAFYAALVLLTLGAAFLSRSRVIRTAARLIAGAWLVGTFSFFYRLAHKRRLEALRRAGIVEREPDGSWRVPEDYLKRAAEFESGKGAANVRVLSFVTLEQLQSAPGATFLDDALDGKRSIEATGHGFGAELKDALGARRRWLLAQGLAEDVDGAFRVDRRALASLQRDAVAREGARLEKRLGKSFIEPVEGERFSTVASMRFYQIDDNGLWRIPKKMKKQKVNDQMMPLGARAQACYRPRLLGPFDAVRRAIDLQPRQPAFRLQLLT